MYKFNWYFDNSSISSEKSIDCNVIEDFIPYSSFNKIMSTFDESRGKMIYAKKAWNNILSEWKNTNITADSVIFSIIRRISRESIGTAKLIDLFCNKFLLGLDHLEYNSEHPLIINFQNAQYIDRASLRVIYRLLKMSRKRNLKVNFIFSSGLNLNGRQKNDFLNIECAIINARETIFTRIKNELKPNIIGEIPDRKMKISMLISSNQKHDFEAALALVTQNYEKALLHTNELIMSSENGNDGEAYRILGIIYANLGNIDDAYSAFKKALENCVTDTKRSHIEYLCGLLATKRFYDMKLAKKHFANGLSYLDSSNEEHKLEYSWLINGTSFMKTIESSKLEGELKQQELEKILREELRALDLIKEKEGQGALYLKFNLYSNISLLLEVMGNYKQAVVCWEQAFKRYISVKSPTSEYLRKVYAYRAGMLNYKAGYTEKGIKLLEESRDISLIHEDRLYLERIYYALGYVQYKEKLITKSLASFLSGVEIAWLLAEDSVKEYIDAILFIAKENNTEEVYLNKINNILEGNLNINIFGNDTLFVIKSPKTKLPSYHPSTDLEDIPDIDMNAYLIKEKVY